MEVRTNQFEFSHGRRPSGRGYWIIAVTGYKGTVPGTVQSFDHEGGGLLSQVLKDAKAAAKARGLCFVVAEVLP